MGWEDDERYPVLTKTEQFSGTAGNTIRGRFMQPLRTTKSERQEDVLMYRIRRRLALLAESHAPAKFRDSRAATSRDLAFHGPSSRGETNGHRVSVAQPDALALPISLRSHPPRAFAWPEQTSSDCVHASAGHDGRCCEADCSHVAKMCHECSCNRVTRQGSDA